MQKERVAFLALFRGEIFFAAAVLFEKEYARSDRERKQSAIERRKRGGNSPKAQGAESEQKGASRIKDGIGNDGEIFHAFIVDTSEK